MSFPLNLSTALSGAKFPLKLKQNSDCLRNKKTQQGKTKQTKQSKKRFNGIDNDRTHQDCALL